MFPEINHENSWQKKKKKKLKQSEEKVKFVAKIKKKKISVTFLLPNFPSSRKVADTVTH